MTGIYSNLIAQLEKLRKHNRQGSIKTKARYYEAMKRFCRFLAEQYRLEKLANIAPKHLHAYLDYLKESGKAPSTIKTDLSAIRFWHDKISAPRHKLPSNDSLDLECRTTGNLDRTWSDDEFGKMLQIAEDSNRTDYIAALNLAYHAGLRHSYACRLYREGKSLHEISRLLGHNRPGVVRVYLVMGL